MQTQNNSRISETIDEATTKNCSRPLSKAHLSVSKANKTKPKHSYSDDDKKEAIAVKYPKRVTDILMNWIIQNKDDPFPDQGAIGDLVELTGLDQSQIVNWTTNVRKRNMKATCEGLKKPHHFIDFLFLAQERDNRRKMHAATMAKQEQQSRDVRDEISNDMDKATLVDPGSDDYAQNHTYAFTSLEPHYNHSHVSYHHPYLYWQHRDQLSTIPSTEASFEPININQVPDFSILFPWSEGVASNPSCLLLDDDDDDYESVSTTMKDSFVEADDAWVDYDCAKPCTAGRSVPPHHSVGVTVSESKNCQHCKEGNFATYERYQDLGELNMNEIDDEYTNDRRVDESGAEYWAFS